MCNIELHFTRFLLFTFVKYPALNRPKYSFFTYSDFYRTKIFNNPALQLYYVKTNRIG